MSKRIAHDVSTLCIREAEKILDNRSFEKEIFQGSIKECWHEDEERIYVRVMIVFKEVDNDYYCFFVDEPLSTGICTRFVELFPGGEFVHVHRVKEKTVRSFEVVK